MQGGPGAIPNGGQGALGKGGIARNDWGRVPGNQDRHIFLGRGRGPPAQARFPPPPQEVGIPCIRRQPHTQPHCFTLRSQSQSQSPAPPPYSPQNHSNPPSYPKLFSSPPPNPCPCKNICPCHKLPTPPPPYANKPKFSSESEDSDEPLPSFL